MISRKAGPGIMLLLLLLVAGCNQSGMTLGEATQQAVPLSEGAAMSSFLAQDDSSSGTSGDDGTLQVAMVHNPEPATMLLWGAGLVGSALMRRKQKKEKI